MPHAHALIFLKKKLKEPTIEIIDEFISAEIPNLSADLLSHESIKKFMMYEPYGLTNSEASFMEKGKCTKHFPKKIQK